MRYASTVHGLHSDHGITEDVKPLNGEGRELPRDLSPSILWDVLRELYLELIATLTEEICEL